MAAVRVPGELASRPGGGHHIRVRHTAVHCDILPGNVAGVQTLQGVQHDDERHENRGGRGARHHRPVLPDRDHMHRVVHVRAVRPLSRLSQQAALLQGRDEHDRHNRHHTVLHHAGHGHRGGGGPHDEPAQGSAEPAGQEHQPGHVAGHTPGHPAREGLQDIQIVPTFQGVADPRTHAESLHARTGIAHFFLVYR